MSGGWSVGFDSTPGPGPTPSHLCWSTFSILVSRMSESLLKNEERQPSGNMLENLTVNLIYPTLAKAPLGDLISKGESDALASYPFFYFITYVSIRDVPSALPCGNPKFIVQCPFEESFVRLPIFTGEYSFQYATQGL